MYDPIMPRDVGNDGAVVEFGDDSKLFKQFYSRTVQDPVASREAGRPIFAQVPYIRIQQRGERDTFDQPANDYYKRRFRKEWEDFQADRDALQSATGTPLAVLFPVNPEIVENLRYLKIFTVEDLAGLNDTQVQNIGMGGMDFRQRAQAFINAADAGKGMHQLQTAIERLETQHNADKERIANLERALTETQAKLEEHRVPPAAPTERRRNG